jgi:Aspartyl/Asparaginyl beta-hydroxylase.
MRGAAETMSRPAFSRLPVTVDLPLLLQALTAIGEGDWHSHFNSDYYAGDWSGVALICAADALTELSPGRGETLLRAPWLQDARWQQGLRDLPLQIVCARLLRLGPGGRIHEHRDYDLGAPDADLRLHIPLLSPPRVDFLLDRQRMPMAAGECWFLDLSRPIAWTIAIPGHGFIWCLIAGPTPGWSKRFSTGWQPRRRRKSVMTL